jgi:hypothetical protein
MIANNKLRGKYKEVVRAYFKMYVNLLRWIKENHENTSMTPVSTLFARREADIYLHLVRT